MLFSSFFSGDPRMMMTRKCRVSIPYRSQSLYIFIIVPFLFKPHNVSETGFCLRLQVEPSQLGPIDRASPYMRNVLLFKQKQDDGYVQKHNICIYVTSSQALRIYMCMKKNRNTKIYKILVENKSRSVVSPRHRCKNIIVDLKERGFVSRKWIRASSAVGSCGHDKRGDWR
jgi:hypothetical protein